MILVLHSDMVFYGFTGTAVPVFAFHFLASEVRVIQYKTENHVYLEKYSPNLDDHKLFGEEQKQGEIIYIFVLV